MLLCFSVIFSRLLVSIPMTSAASARCSSCSSAGGGSHLDEKDGVGRSAFAILAASTCSVTNEPARFDRSKFCGLHNLRRAC
jgi:hypothetical protein